MYEKDLKLLFTKKTSESTYLYELLRILLLKNYLARPGFCEPVMFRATEDNDRYTKWLLRDPLED